MSPAGEFAASLWGCAYLADCAPPPPCAESELWLPKPLSDVPATITWCAERDHPWLTYNPHMDRTWCRCGQRTTTTPSLTPRAGATGRAPTRARH